MGRGVMGTRFRGTTHSDATARKLSLGCRTALLFAVELTR
jgi:hypothetical protein